MEGKSALANKRIKVLAGIAIGIFLISEQSLSGNIAAKGWRDLVPLHSTRVDVERLLGVPRNQSDCVDNLCTYVLSDVNVLFHYSAGNCASGRGAWDVPPDTVVYITVYPKPADRWSSLEIDKAKFRRTPDEHIKQLVSYVNEEEGLIIRVNEDIDEVSGFYYVPSARDKHLRCR
jgi:hypothetical protein